MERHRKERSRSGRRKKVSGRRKSWKKKKLEEEKVGRRKRCQEVVGSSNSGVVVVVVVLPCTAKKANNTSTLPMLGKVVMRFKYKLNPSLRDSKNSGFVFPNNPVMWRLEGRLTRNFPYRCFKAPCN